MRFHSKKKIVLLGMMSRHPVAGSVWLTMQYLVGFKRLGYDVYYVDSAKPQAFMDGQDDGSTKAAAFIASAMQYFDLPNDRWAFHALHSDGHCYGLSRSQIKELYLSADLLINLHGATLPLPEQSATKRLVYLGTDPVDREVQLFHNDQNIVDLMAQHCAIFTWGENYGKSDCGVPVSDRFDFKPTRQPVLIDLWESNGVRPGQDFTTVGNWRQPHRKVRVKGEIYHWSKHFEFLKFIDLPSKTDQTFEIALSRFGEEDRQTLESKGWKVRDGLSVSTDLDTYRQYILQSRGEFAVAKDQNIRLRSGWFSDRSATYLAAGRPVITQETGFANILPTGEGLFAFSTMDEIVDAIDRINSNGGIQLPQVATIWRICGAWGPLRF